MSGSERGKTVVADGVHVLGVDLEFFIVNIFFSNFSNHPYHPFMHTPASPGYTHTATPRR
jgi:hypothetical protein